MTDDGAVSSASNAGATSRSRQKPTKALPTRRLSFDSQIKVLRGFAAVYEQTGEPVSNQAAGDLAGVTADTLSLNNRFFSDNGFLRRVEGQYVPANDVIAFQQAHQWAERHGGAEPGEKLAPLVRSTWFAGALLPHLTMGSKTEDEAIRVLAEACKAPPKYRNQIETLLDYLGLAAVIERENGYVSLGKQHKAGAPKEAGNVNRHDPAPAQSELAPQMPVKSHRASAPGREGAVEFNVSLSVDMAEFATWSPERINAFFGGLAKVLAAKADMGPFEEGG